MTSSGFWDIFRFVCLCICLQGLNGCISLIGSEIDINALHGLEV